MSISKITKRNGVWHYYRSVNGKRFRKSLGTSNKQSAILRQRKLDADIDAGLDGTKKYLLADVADEYFNAMKAVKSQTYSKRLKIHFNQIKSHLGDINIDDIRPSHINQFINDRLASGAAKKTVRCDVSELRRLFLYAIGERMTGWNPVDVPTVARPKNEVETPRIVVPHNIMVQIFEQALKLGLKHDVMYWKIIYYTGLRPADAGTLTPDKIQYEGTTQKKTGFPVALFMHPEIEQYGNDIYNAAETEWNHRRESRKNLKMCAEAVGWDNNIDLHTLRHCFATRLQELGLSAEDIKIMTGHSTSQMVANYSHPRYDYVRETLKGLS